jgi:DNA modification methylase
MFGGILFLVDGCCQKNTLGPDRYLPPSNAANVGRARQYRGQCGICGATRVDSQIGLETTPDAYVAAMVAVFAEVRRVLKVDGTMWLNLGDSYAGGATLGRNDAGRNFTGGGGNILGSGNPGRQGAHVRDTGLKSKDLVGIPWRVAFALQADGWYLRSDIIWSKPNPMPESVTDRPTKAHEYIFLLTKSARYYYDSKAITEPIAESTLVRPSRLKPGAGTGPCVGDNDSHSARTGKGLTATVTALSGRNKRSVWTVGTHPYPEAHFATFPEDLIKPCILAGSKPGDLVLDPFTGSGTTGAVAIRHQRQFVGVELNPAYVELARKRIGAVSPLFATEVSA